MRNNSFCALTMFEFLADSVVQDFRSGEAIPQDNKFIFKKERLSCHKSQL